MLSLKKIYLKILGKYRLLGLLDSYLKEGITILDVGCGKNSPLRKIKKRGHRTGIDHYLPYLDQAKEKAIHDEYVEGNILNMPFSANSFDYAVSTEVLEHLEKEDGFKMLSEMERIARKKIILTTPNGFLKTYAGPKDNPDEAHLSGWTVKELEDRGFKVMGLGGWKHFWRIKDGKALPKSFMPKLFMLLMDISQIFIFSHPEHAFQLFAVKNLEK